MPVIVDVRGDHAWQDEVNFVGAAIQKCLAEKGFTNVEFGPRAVRVDTVHENYPEFSEPTTMYDQLAAAKPKLFHTPVLVSVAQMDDTQSFVQVMHTTSGPEPKRGDVRRID